MKQSTYKKLKKFKNKKSLTVKRELLLFLCKYIIVNLIKV